MKKSRIEWSAAKVQGRVLQGLNKSVFSTPEQQRKSKTQATGGSDAVGGFVLFVRQIFVQGVFRETREGLKRVGPIPSRRVQQEQPCFAKHPQTLQRKRTEDPTASQPDRKNDQIQIKRSARGECVGVYATGTF